MSQGRLLVGPHLSTADEVGGPEESKEGRRFGPGQKRREIQSHWTATFLQLLRVEGLKQELLFVMNWARPSLGDLEVVGKGSGAVVDAILMTPKQISQPVPLGWPEGRIR